MGKFIEIFNTAGGIGLFVDAKDHAAKRYYEHSLALLRCLSWPFHKFANVF